MLNAAVQHVRFRSVYLVMICDIFCACVYEMLLRGATTACSYRSNNIMDLFALQRGVSDASERPERGPDRCGRLVGGGVTRTGDWWVEA